MKKLLLTLLLLPTIAYSAVTFPVNGGTGTSTKPTLGQVLIGLANGTYGPVSTSSLGISGGTGVSNAYASSTFVTYDYGSSTYTGGGISNAYASSTFPSFQYATDTYATQASLGLYVPFSYATNTFATIANLSSYYLASNPSGYITNSVSNLTNYPSYAYATNTYYFASNPSGYITSSALTPYVPYSYASTTFASTSWVLGTFVPFSYGSSTFPTFTYASTTFASTSWVTSTFPTFTYATATFATSSGLYTNFMRYAYGSTTFPTFTYASSAYYLATNPSNYITNSVSNLTNYPTYTYATNTYVTYGYGSSTYGGGGGITNAYASSSFVKVIDDQTVTGEKTFNGTTTLATTTHRSAVRDSVNSAGSSGQVLQSTGTSTLWVTNSASGLSGSGTNGKVARFSAVSTVADGALLDNGTVAGINATTSTVSVNIQGGSGLLPLRIASSTGNMMMQVGVDGSFIFATTTATSTGSNDGMAVQSKSFAQFNTLTIKNPLDRIETPLQSALWNKNVVWRTPGIVAAGLCENTVCTNAGSVALVLPTVTNAYTAMRRTTFATVVTTNNQQVGVRTAAQFFRGTNQVNGPHLGGFFFAVKMGFTTWTNGDDLFVGLATCTTACITGTTTVSNLANMVGFVVERGRNTIYFATNDASGAISTTTIAGLPTLASNQGFDMYIYAPANRHEIHWRIDNASTSAIIATGTVTSNLPATTTLLLGHVQMGNGLNTTVGAATLGVGKIYIESER